MKQETKSMCTWPSLHLTVQHQCPLDPSRLEFMKWTCHDLREIEDHISAGNCPHPPLKHLVLKGSLEGSTPLLLACQNGQLDSIKRIVKLWRVNVRSSGVYHGLWNMRIEGATPIFVATVNCHIDIVRYLVKKGADVSSRTSGIDSGAEFAGITPLQAAITISNDIFYPGITRKIKKRTSIIRFLLKSGADPNEQRLDGTPIWLHNSCTTKIITLLVKSGLDLTQRCPKSDRTILHYWAVRRTLSWRDDLRVVKLLLDKGADLKALDDVGFTPLLKAANFFNYPTLNFLLEREDIGRLDKINALELAGALILSTEGCYSLQFPFEFWQRALHLRLLETKGCGPLYKVPLNLNNRRIVEWTTLAELEQLKHGPPFDYKIQALLVRIRIFSTMGWKAVYRYVWPGARELTKRSHHNQWAQIVEVLWIMLGTIRLFDPHEIGIWPATVEVHKLLITALLGELQSDDPFLNVETIRLTMKLILATDQSHLPDVEGLEHIPILFKFMFWIRCLPNRLINEDITKFWTQWVCRDSRSSNGNSLLHYICELEPTDYTLATVRQLLQLGVDPNLENKCGNSPLHILARIVAKEKRYNRDLIDSIALILLDAGAHLDRVNKEGMTAADVWFMITKNLNPSAVLDLPDWCRGSVPKLICLSARVIRRYKISYEENGELLIPISLRSFVEMH